MNDSPKDFTRDDLVYLYAAGKVMLKSLPDDNAERPGLIQAIERAEVIIRG